MRTLARSRAEMVRAIDSLAMAPVARGQVAGISVAVVKGRDTILIKGYGSADLDLDVATPANAVDEIGSVTKQFTTAALLQLVEHGKLTYMGNDMFQGPNSDRYSIIREGGRVAAIRVDLISVVSMARRVE